jgi:hypothetical protein
MVCLMLSGIRRVGMRRRRERGRRTTGRCGVASRKLIPLMRSPSEIANRLP